MVVKLRKQGDLSMDLISLPAASATVFDQGQLISCESNKAVKLDAATEDITFAGVAMDKKVAGEDYPDVVICTKGIFEGAVASAAYTLGEALAYNASNDNLESSTANTIAWAAEDTKGVTVTTLKVMIDVKALGKLYKVNA
jgi:hypothetical protein